MKGSSASGIGSALLFGRQIGPNTPPPTIPVNIVPPLITGGAYLNTQLTCSTGTWSGGGTMTFTYQWKRAGVNISGATNSTYTMVTADTADSLPVITCTVTATNETVTPVAANSSNSKLCTPVITMSCNKIGGSMAFAGTLTRKGSPSTVIVQWGDNTNTSVTTTLSKTYSTTGVKNIRVYSELNNIVTFNVTTTSTRLVSFTATEVITSITGISITGQSTAGIFTTLTVKNLPALTSITLTSATLTALTSTQIDNLPALTTLSLGSMTVLTNITLPVFPSLLAVLADNCTLLATLSVNNNPTITQIRASRGALTSLNISALTELSILVLGTTGQVTHTISSLDVTPNNKLTNLQLIHVGLSTFTHGTLPALIALNLVENSLSGSFSLTSPLLTDLRVNNNNFSSITVSSLALITVTLQVNNLTTFSVANQLSLNVIDVRTNHMSGATISHMLGDLVTNGVNGGSFAGESQSPAAPLNAQGLLDKATLVSRSWNVTVDP